MKSHRLAAFLKFICDQYFAGHADAINEQRIGTEVFGRRPGYHVGEDSIVRSQARFLRQRLEEYFSTVGRQEPFVLSIPKGSYVPSFERREVQSPAPVLPAAAPVPIPLPVERPVSRMLPRLVFVVAGVLIVGAALLAFYRGREQKAPEQAPESPAVAAFWSSLFRSDRPTLIVPSDSTLVLLEQLSGKPVHLHSYINKDYLQAPAAVDQALWRNLVSSQYTNMADLNLVAHLGQVREAVHERGQIRYARDLSLKELKDANAILIGGPRSNPWLELFSSAFDFDVDHDFATGHNVVRNLTPGAGEQALYVENTTDTAETSRAYGVVVYLPGLDRAGRVLLVEGTSKPGTEAAAEFLTSPAFAQFLQKIGGNAGAIPNFELLLSTGSMNGASYNPAIVCWHPLRKIPSN
ncbi:MAG: hypothetical protein WCE75_08635 [Terracidiphilus sp.]